MQYLFDGLNLQSSGPASDLKHWSGPKPRPYYEEAKLQSTIFGGFYPESLMAAPGRNEPLDIASLLSRVSVDPMYPSNVFDPTFNMFPSPPVHSHGQGITPEDTLISLPSSPSDAYPSPSSTMSQMCDYSMSEDGHSGSSSDYAARSKRLLSTRRMARTRANRTTGTPYSNSSPQTEPPRSSSSRTLKRNFDTVLEHDDAGSAYSLSEDGSLSDDGSSDGFTPSSIGSDDEDIEPRRFSPPRNSRSSQTRTPTKGKKVAPRHRKVSGSKSTASSKTKLVLLHDEHSNDDGLLTCGLIVEKVGKGGRYTAKGMRTPAVGDVCGMRCKAHEMTRHQQTASWHQNSLWVCHFCSKPLAGREDNQKRHLST